MPRAEPSARGIFFSRPPPQVRIPGPDVQRGPGKPCERSGRPRPHNRPPNMIVWKTEFDTGVAEVDHDHKRLVEGLNKLEELLQTGRGSESIPAVLGFLERYANEHFAREEACMHRLKCPNAAANVAAHAQFRQTFAKAKDKLQNASAGALVARQVHGELVAWITNHILRIDMGLRSCPRTG